MRALPAILTAATILGLCAAVGSQPAATAPAGNLDYWLGRARPAAATTAPAPEGVNPFAREGADHPAAAVPGVVELSNGRRIPGWLHTTGGGPLEVFVEEEKRWRRVPPAAALSLSAIVVKHTPEPDWRWQAMGTPERVYTGQTRPSLRLLWRIHLADDSEIVGAIKGEPIHVFRDGRRLGPFVLYERLRGRAGEKPEDVVYARRVVISRRAMEQVLAEGRESRPATQPSERK